MLPPGRRSGTTSPLLDSAGDSCRSSTAAPQMGMWPARDPHNHRWEMVFFLLRGIIPQLFHKSPTSSQLPLNAPFPIIAKTNRTSFLFILISPFLPKPEQVCVQIRTKFFHKIRDHLVRRIPLAAAHRSGFVSPVTFAAQPPVTNIISLTRFGKIALVPNISASPPPAFVAFGRFSHNVSALLLHMEPN